MVHEATQPLGDVLREARIAAKLSLRDLASRVGKTASYLSDIENNRRVPAEDVLRTLADLFELEFDDLMARAGRFGDDARRYMMRTPAAGVLMRKLSAVNAPPELVDKLAKFADEKMKRKQRK